MKGGSSEPPSVFDPLVRIGVLARSIPHIYVSPF
jgi:hypothetical protein